MKYRRLFSLLSVAALAIGTGVAQAAPPAAATPQAATQTTTQSAPQAAPQKVYEKRPNEPWTKPAPQCADHHSFMSPAMAREMNYCIILPIGYAQTSERYPVLYLLHGLWGDEDDWQAKTKIGAYARRLKLIVVMPEGDDGWYTNSATDPRNRYEDYVFTDLIHEIESKYRVNATREARFIAGLSMGGYGAFKGGVKYPDRYSYVGAFSAAFGATRMPPSAAIKTPELAFGAPDDPARRKNDDYALVAKADPAKLPYFFLTVGAQDGLRDYSLAMANLMRDLNVKYEYHEWPGVHEWPVWDRSAAMFLLYLRYAGAVQPADGSIASGDQ